MIQVHVDVDNLWNYENEYGISFGKDKEFLFENALPRALELFTSHDIRATFFIVGSDLDLESARNFCKDVVKAGHAIANHTYSHHPNFSRMSPADKMIEIKKCHDAIVGTTGVRPVGFRSPGYYLDEDIIKILNDLEYRYDGSVLPGFSSAIMHAYSNLKGGDGSKGKAFGRRRYIFSSRKPRMIKVKDSSSNFLSLPISVAPFIRLPSHSTFVYHLGYCYFSLLRRLYKMSPKDHIYLFHAIDFIDLGDCANDTAAVPPLRLNVKERMSLNDEICRMLKDLNGDSISTTEDQLNQIDISRIDNSLLMSCGLPSYGSKK
jgi:peptidoglycan-N-acetylglucosamine deacetylase